MQFNINEYTDEQFNSVRVVEATDFDDLDDAQAVKAVYQRFVDVDDIPGLQVLASRCEFDPPSPEETQVGKHRPGVTLPPGLKRRILVAIVWTIAAEPVAAGSN
jgi:hypothetical protein